MKAILTLTVVLLLASDCLAESELAGDRTSVAKYYPSQAPAPLQGPLVVATEKDTKGEMKRTTKKTCCGCSQTGVCTCGPNCGCAGCDKSSAAQSSKKSSFGDVEERVTRRVIRTVVPRYTIMPTYSSPAYSAPMYAPPAGCGPGGCGAPTFSQPPAGLPSFSSPGMPMGRGVTSQPMSFGTPSFSAPSFGGFSGSASSFGGGFSGRTSAPIGGGRGGCST